MIDPPKRQDHYADRHLDCEAALETTFQTIIEEMATVGWSREEIGHAIFKSSWAHRRSGSKTRRSRPSWRLCEQWRERVNE